MNRMYKSTTDQTNLTQQLLIDNGWEQIEDTNEFKYQHKINDGDSLFITISCIDDFACFLIANELIHGEHFTTVGEMKAISSALYKVELEFK